MDDLCDLAAVIVGRSRTCHGMYRFNSVSRSIRRPTESEPDLRVNPRGRDKYVFTIACRAYAKETRSGLLYTRESLPKRMVSLIQLREIFTVLTRRSAQVPRPGPGSARVAPRHDPRRT